MPETTPAYQRFFAELKRRKVFRVAAVYGAVAFGTIQLADPVAAALGFPGWFMPMVIVALLLGFPVALILAWALELGPDGLKRTESARPGEIEHIVAQPRLRRWASGALALAGVAALVVAAWFGGRSSAAGAEGDVAATAATAPESEAGPSIAVLPFENMSADESQVYFAEGISEELLNLLAKIPELRVAARTSSFSFKGQNLEITQIADSLGVAHVLEGSVRKSGELVRVTAQLIRADDGFHVWSETWDRTLDDIFAIQDEIARDVVGQLRVTLLAEAPMVEETDPEAYALVLQARHVIKQGNREAALSAEALFRRALDIDPGYSAAWSGLAAAYNLMSGPLGFPHDSMAALSGDAARRALDLDPRNATAYSVLGSLAISDGDLAAGARFHERSLALRPGDTRVAGAVAVTLLALNRIDEAVRAFGYIVRRDPVSVAGHGNLGLAYVGARRFQEARDALRTALALNPSTPALRGLLGYVLVSLDRPAEGLESALQEPDEFWRLVALAQVHHALGRRAESDAALAALVDGHADEAAFNIAYIHAFRGEEDLAFEWLDRAVRDEDPGLSEIFVYPQFAALEDDPRWPRFLARIGKAPEDLAAIELRVDLPE